MQEYGALGVTQRGAVQEARRAAAKNASGTEGEEEYEVQGTKVVAGCLARSCFRTPYFVPCTPFSLPSTPYPAPSLLPSVSSRSDSTG